MEVAQLLRAKTFETQLPGQKAEQGAALAYGYLPAPSKHSHPHGGFEPVETQEVIQRGPQTTNAAAEKRGTLSLFRLHIYPWHNSLHGTPQMRRVLHRRSGSGTTTYQSGLSERQAAEAMSAQQVAPTRMALQTYKGKLLGAKKGYELLKKKSDALKVTDFPRGSCLPLCPWVWQ